MFLREKKATLQEKALSKEIQTFSILPSHFELHFWTSGIPKLFLSLADKAKFSEAVFFIKGDLTHYWSGPIGE